LRSVLVLRGGRALAAQAVSNAAHPARSERDHDDGRSAVLMPWARGGGKRRSTWCWPTPPSGAAGHRPRSPVGVLELSPGAVVVFFGPEDSTVARGAGGRRRPPDLIPGRGSARGPRRVGGEGRSCCCCDSKPLRIRISPGQGRTACNAPSRRKAPRRATRTANSTQRVGWCPRWHRVGTGRVGRHRRQWGSPGRP